jgi:hypothetical protein
VEAGLLLRDVVTVSRPRGLCLQRAPYTDGWCSDVVEVDIPGVDSVGLFVDTMCAAEKPLATAQVYRYCSPFISA